VARLPLFEGPLLAHIDRVDVFESVLLCAAHAGLEPRIEKNATVCPQEIADPVTPAAFLFMRARSDEIHRAGKINARPPQEVVLLHRASIGRAKEKLKPCLAPSSAHPRLISLKTDMK